MAKHLLAWCRIRHGFVEIEQKYIYRRGGLLPHVEKEQNMSGFEVVTCVIEVSCISWTTQLCHTTSVTTSSPISLAFTQNFSRTFCAQVKAKCYGIRSIFLFFTELPHFLAFLLKFRINPTFHCSLFLLRAHPLTSFAS